MPDEAPATFQSLTDYDVPAMPTIDAFQAFWARTRELFRHQPDGPLISDDRLRHSTSEILEEIVSPPACGPLVSELDATLADWLADPRPRIGHRLIVLPPGDRNGVLQAWAVSGNYDILEAPARDDILDDPACDVPPLEGKGPLVIPALEDWFIRHRNGLGLIRALLARLDGLQRHVVVGCNSWAWQFLVQAVHADVVLGPPITFQAFDAPRLRDWFSQMAVSERLGPVEFLDSRTGKEILAVDENEDVHDVLVALAARSRGIPWIAWRLWRRSLRDRALTEDDADDAELSETAQGATTDEKLTLWVIALEEFSLPGANRTDTLLVLQALLIHGALTPQQLGRVLPVVGESNMLAALLAAGIVEREGEHVYCAPAAYAAIRSGLSTAGFPIAAL